MAILYYLPPQFKNSATYRDSNSTYTRTNSKDNSYYVKKAFIKRSLNNDNESVTEDITYTVKNTWDRLLPAKYEPPKEYSINACKCGCAIAPISKIDQFIAAYDEAAPINDFTTMSEVEIERFLAGLTVDIDCSCADHTCPTHETLLLRDLSKLISNLAKESDT